MDSTAEFNFQESQIISKRHPEIGALTLLVGGEPGRSILLDSARVEVGRGQSCDLQFAVEGVSRSHMVIERRGDYRYALRDLGSTNGVFVNGDKVPSHQLEDGDRVALGPNLVFVFRHLQLDEAIAVEGMSVSRARDRATGALTEEFFLELLRLELELGQRRNFDLCVICIKVIAPALADESARAFFAYLQSQRRPGSSTSRLNPSEFAQTVTYVSLQELEKGVDKLESGLTSTFPDWGFVMGVGLTRSIACPTAELLIGKARMFDRTLKA